MQDEDDEVGWWKMMENDGKWWKMMEISLWDFGFQIQDPKDIYIIFWCVTSHLRSLQSDPGSSEAKKHTVRFFLHTLGQMFSPGVGLPDTASSHCRIEFFNPRFECQNRFQHRWAIVRWGLPLHHLPNAWPPDSGKDGKDSGNLVCKIVRNCAVDQCMVWLDEPFPKLATQAEVQSELDLAQWKILSNQTLVGW